MDALYLLEQDHINIRSLFESYDQAASGSPTAETLYAELVAELCLHAIIEEQNFYPLLANVNNTLNMVDESYYQHTSHKILLSELSQLDIFSPAWVERFETLKIEVGNHFSKEEKWLFPKIREMLTPVELDLLGWRLRLVKTLGRLVVDGSLLLPSQYNIQIEQLKKKTVGLVEIIQLEN